MSNDASPPEDHSNDPTIRRDVEPQQSTPPIQQQRPTTPIQVQTVDTKPYLERAEISSIQTSSTGDFRGIVMNVASGNAESCHYKVQLPNIQAQINLGQVKVTNTPSKYIKELRSALQRAANTILTQNLGTLQENWNMAVRDGKSMLELVRMANGYFDEKGHHSFEEGTNVAGTYKYPLNLLLLGLDAYEAEEARLQAALANQPFSPPTTSTDELKVGVGAVKATPAPPPTKTLSAKKIDVKTGEIRRFNFVNVIDTVQSAFREMFKDQTLTVTAEFVNIYDDGLGVPQGYWSINLSWQW